MMSKARKHKSLIIDLRGNGGGAETTLLRMLGGVFDHDVKLGEIKRRKETKPLVAKTRGDNAFKGNLVVLVDSQSGSAAELFARVVQLEKRGAIVGDRSAGAVMRSKFYDHQSGTESVAFYGASITDADITMTDGKILSGFVVRESGDEVEIRETSGDARVLKKEEIDERRQTRDSMMPEGRAELPKKAAP